MSKIIKCDQNLDQTKKKDYASKKKFEIVTTLQQNVAQDSKKLTLNIQAQVNVLP